MSQPARQFTGRRAHRRVEATIPIEIVPDDSPEVIHGTTVTLGRGGMLVNLESAMAVHDTCVVRFTAPGVELSVRKRSDEPSGQGNAHSRTIPGQTVRGRVTRVYDGLTAAVEFATLLDVIDGP